ncbi:MAG: PAS domain S-box protein [Gloeotrichia echinulata GP01]
MQCQNQLIDLPNLYHAIDHSPLTITYDSYVIEAIVLMSQAPNTSVSVSNSHSLLDSNGWSHQGTSYILVVEGGRLLGIFTHRDVVRLTAAGMDLSKVRIAEVMTRQVVTCKQSSSGDILTALSLLRQHRISHLPIVDDRQQLLGIVTETSLLQAFDLVKMVGVVEGLQQPLQQPTDELRVELSRTNALLQREITERQRVQEAWRQSEKLYRELVESQQDLIVRFDLEGLIIFANTATCQTFGLSLDELRGRSLWEFTHPDDLPQAMDNMTALLSPPHSLNITEKCLLTVNGVRWFEWKITSIEDETGEVIEFQSVGRDITERQQMEAALEESEQKFRNFADNSQAVIWIASHDKLENMYVNPVYEKIWGRSCQSLRDQPYDWIDAIHLEDRDRAVANLLLQRLGQSYEVEYRLVRPDGSIRWIWDRGFPIRDEQGKIYAHGGIAEDITERKLSKESLRESEERLSLALESAYMGIWDWNLLTNECVWSHHMGPLYGLPIGFLSLTYETLVNFIHPDDRQSFSLAITRSIDQGIDFAIEYRVIWSDGSVHWLSSNGKVYHNEHGQPVRMLGVSRDINHRKQAQEKMREQADLLDITTDAILVRDLQNQIVFWNQGAERLYGWNENEVLGRNVIELLYKQTPPQLEAALQKVIECGSWEGELNKVQKSGTEIIVQSRWSLVRDARERPKAILCVDTDITEKKQLEAQFFRAQRLESLGTLAGGIAHDLNNILTPILASAQLLQLKCPRNQEPYQQLLPIIENNAKRGAALVKQVLSFARGVKGEQTMVQVKHLIGEISQIIKQTFPKSIKLIVTIPEDLGVVYGDITQLHQVLMNLVVNARDAMPEGGNLSILAENKFIDQAYAKMNINAKVGDYIVITVADTGIGMPPEILERIFEPFFTTKDVGAGTGLGLATVLGIIKSHDGFVNVTTKVGKGSEFQLFLPDAEATQDPDTEDSELPKGNGELILIVDDESEIRQITKIILENNNYRTIIAKNGIEAIALYAQYKHQISAVLMDMMMPEMDGITAIRTLQKMNPQVQIIASSGLNPTESLAEFGGTNVQAVLTKPYTAKDLLNKLQDTCAGG